MKAFNFVMMSVVLILFASCSTNSNNSTTAGRNVSFLVTDAPMWYNLKAVNVEITGIDYQIVGDTSNWHTMTPFNAGVYNLKALSNGLYKPLGQLQLPNIELIKNIRLNLGTNNTVVLGNDSVKPLNIWNSQNKVIIHVNQTHTTATGDSIMVDFNLARSIVYTHNGYMLKPVLRGFITTQTTAIDGFLTPDTLNCKSAYKIYIIYNGDTLTTVTDLNDHNHFRIMGLPADSTYTIQIVPVNGTSNPFQLQINTNKKGYLSMNNIDDNWQNQMKNWQNQWWGLFFHH